MASHGLAVASNKNTSIVKPDLENRIAEAFGNRLSSFELDDLLIEVAQADREAKVAAASLNESALDPATSPDAVSKARKNAEDAEFRRLRMERAAVKLGELRDAALKQEQEAEHAAAHAVAIAERDQLVKDLSEYDELSRKIVNLLERLQTSNARVGDFLSAEIEARNAGERWAVQVDLTLPKLLSGVRLPKFRRDGTNHGYVWPPQRGL